MHASRNLVPRWACVAPQACCCCSRSSPRRHRRPLACCPRYRKPVRPRHAGTPPGISKGLNQQTALGCCSARHGVLQPLASAMAWARLHDHARALGYGCVLPCTALQAACKVVAQVCMHLQVALRQLDEQCGAGMAQSSSRCAPRCPPRTCSAHQLDQRACMHACAHAGRDQAATSDGNDRPTQLRCVFACMAHAAPITIIARITSERPAGASMTPPCIHTYIHISLRAAAGQRCCMAPLPAGLRCPPLSRSRPPARRAPPQASGRTVTCTSMEHRGCCNPWQQTGRSPHPGGPCGCETRTLVRAKTTASQRGIPSAGGSRCPL